MALCSFLKPGDIFKIEQKDYDYINSKKDLSEKLFVMASILELTKMEICERDIILSDITQFLKPFYPNCLVVAFGSSVNGFGFKGCDLDLLFLPFPEYCNLDFKDTENVTIPKPQQILKEKFPKEKLLSMNESCHLKFIQRIMFSKRYYFERVHFIPAKCPILNIEFVGSDIACDFSATNRLVLRNSELLWLYGKLNACVRPIVMFLRFWAKSLGFIEKSLLSSYAFSLLVIFYLQNTGPPILPSVKSLIDMSGFSYKIDEWETGICTDLSLIPMSENSSSVEELLMGFFDFYWNFDFVRNVVSPYTGKAISITDLLKSSDERIKTFPVTPFSIQDPFILSRNISRNATMKTSFKLALLIAKKLLMQGDSFQNLFDFSLYEEEMNKVFMLTMENYPDQSYISSTVQLNNELCCKLGVTNDLNFWYDKVCQTVLDVLQTGLLFECEVIDKAINKNKVSGEPARKKRKLDSCNVASLELLMSIQCAVYYNTWHSRTKILESDPDSIKDVKISNALQKEHNLSVILIGGYDIVQSPEMWFLCDCYKYSPSQISDVVLIFSPLSNKSMFSSMTKFVKSFVQKYVIKILSEESSENSPSS